MNNLINDVLLFHKTFGHPVLPKPAIPPPERQVLRSKLIRDEYQGEFDPAWSQLALLGKALKEAPEAGDALTRRESQVEALAEFGDAIADVIYYLIGTALEYGIPLQEIWDAVQKANMSKLWTYEETTLPGKVEAGWKVVADPLDEEEDSFSENDTKFIVYDETGKVRKPPSWKEPDIKAIIRKAMGCSLPSDQLSSP